MTCTAHHPLEALFFSILWWVLLGYAVLVPAVALASPKFVVRRVWIPFSVALGGGWVVGWTLTYNWSTYCLDLFPSFWEAVLISAAVTAVFAILTGSYSELVSWIVRRWFRRSGA